MLDLYKNNCMVLMKGVLKELLKNNKKNINNNKYIKMFREVAKENNISIRKINSIIYGSQTIYNPLTYEHTNYWVQQANK